MHEQEGPTREAAFELGINCAACFVANLLSDEMAIASEMRAEIRQAHVRAVFCDESRLVVDAAPLTFPACEHHVTGVILQ
jgi:hypothetical protein